MRKDRAQPDSKGPAHDLARTVFDPAMRFTAGVNGLARALATGALFAGATAAAIAGTGHSATGARAMKWILNGPALSALAADASANRFLKDAQPFVMQRDGDPGVPQDWKALPIRSYTSDAHLKRALETNAVDPNVRAILYDNEGWAFTPAEEQRDPATYTRMAAELVHAHHLLFITAPAVDLTRTLAPGPEKRYDAYLRLRLAADSARYADVYNIQAQGSERNVERYSSFVKAAAQQARSANPKVIVLAGISTNPSGLRVSADDVMRAIDATRTYVQGYWFNIPQPGEYCPKCNDFRPDIAIEVFRRLSSAR